MIFEKQPNYARIFYNLVRKQVNYIDEKNNLIQQLKALACSNIVYSEFTDNYIDIACNTSKGIAYTSNFKSIVDKIYEYMVSGQSEKNMTKM